MKQIELMHYIVKEKNRNNIKKEIDNYYKMNTKIDLDQENVNLLINNNKYFIFEYLFKSGYLYVLEDMSFIDIDNSKILAKCIDTYSFLFDEDYMYFLLKMLDKKEIKSNSMTKYIKKVYNQTRNRYTDEICNPEEFKENGQLYQLSIICYLKDKNYNCTKYISRIVELIDNDYLWKIISLKGLRANNIFDSLLFSHVIQKNKLNFFDISTLFSFKNIDIVEEEIKNRYKNEITENNINKYMDMLVENYKIKIAYNQENSIEKEYLNNMFLNIISDCISNDLLLFKTYQLLNNNYISEEIKLKLKDILKSCQLSEYIIRKELFYFSNAATIDTIKDLIFFKQIYEKNKDLFSNNCNYIHNDLRTIILIDMF